MLTQIGHSTYRVSNLDASLEFYGKLGLTEAFRLDIPRDGGVLQIVYLRLNDNQFIELFVGGTEKPETTFDTIGYHHLCFLADDLKATVAELQGRGIVLDQPFKMGPDGNLQAWVVDPDGNRVELMQIMPDSPHVKTRPGSAPKA